MTKPPIAVVSTARNAERFAGRCVRSVRNQSVPCHHFYVDDDSDDNTHQEAEAAATVKARNEHTTTTVIRTFTGNQGQNLIDVITPLSPDTIVVWLDGDDWLWSSSSLEHVLEAHLDGAWVTYGQFIHGDGSPGWAQAFQVDRLAGGQVLPIDFRKQGNFGTHLRTFRAGLFQQINQDHLRQVYTIDVGVMWPVLEMAGERHRFIPEVLVCYEDNPNAARHTGEVTAERERADYLRQKAMKPYARLERATW